MANLKNLRNEFQEALGRLFDEIPTSVLAAIAVSALTGGGDWLENAQKHIANEWHVLHLNGIVSQKPGKVAKQFISKESL